MAYVNPSLSVQKSSSSSAERQREYLLDMIPSPSASVRKWKSHVLNAELLPSFPKVIIKIATLHSMVREPHVIEWKWKHESIDDREKKALDGTDAGVNDVQ